MPKTKEIFIHNKSELPIDGWFQLCYYCNTITARTVLFHMFYNKKVLYEFHVYTCPSCSKKFKRDSNIYIDFNNKCTKYIKRRYSYLFSSGTDPSSASFCIS